MTKFRGQIFHKHIQIIKLMQNAGARSCINMSGSFLTRGEVAGGREAEQADQTGRFVAIKWRVSAWGDAT